jgi:hypothetical protein
MYIYIFISIYIHLYLYLSIYLNIYPYSDDSGGCHENNETLIQTGILSEVISREPKGTVVLIMMITMMMMMIIMITIMMMIMMITMMMIMITMMMMMMIMMITMMMMIMMMMMMMFIILTSDILSEVISREPKGTVRTSTCSYPDMSDTNVMPFYMHFHCFVHRFYFVVLL